MDRFKAIRVGGSLGAAALLLGLLAFCAMCAFTKNGFTLAGDWSALSYPFRFERLETVSIAFVVLLLCALVARRRFGDGNLILVLAPLLAVICGKAGALTALVTFALASVGLGRAILNGLDREHDGEKRDGLEAAAFAFFLGLCTNGFLLWIALHFKINYGWTYYLAFGLQLLLFRRQIVRSGRDFRESYGAWKNQWWALVLVIPCVLFLPYALYATYSHDDLYFHLYLPAYTALYGEYHFNPTTHVWSFNTTITSMGVYSGLHLTGGEFAVRMLNHLMNMTAVMVLLQFARHRYGNRVAGIAGLFVVTTPYLVLVTGLVFVDAFSLLASALIYTQAFRLSKRLSWRGLVLFFVLVGFGYFCKQLCLVFSVPALFVVLVAIVRERRWRFLAGVPMGVGIFGLMLSPVLIYNYVRTKNPVFPFMNAYFKSPDYSTTNFDGNRAKLWNAPFDTDLLYDITFTGSRFVENYDYLFGFSYFVFLWFLPVLFFVREKRLLRDGLCMLGLLLAYTFLLQKTSGIYIRYFIGSLFVGGVLVGLIADAILRLPGTSRPGTSQPGRSRVLHGVLVVLIGGVFTLNAMVQHADLAYAPKYPLSDAVRNDPPQHPVKPVYDYVAVKYGKRTRGMVFDASHLYFAKFYTVGAAWYNHRNNRMLAQAKTAEEVYQLIFKRWHSSFIIMRETPKHFPLLSSPEFRGMIELEFSRAGFGVYRPKQ